MPLGLPARGFFFCRASWNPIGFAGTLTAMEKAMVLDHLAKAKAHIALGEEHLHNAN